MCACGTNRAIALSKAVPNIVIQGAMRHSSCRVADPGPEERKREAQSIPVLHRTATRCDAPGMTINFLQAIVLVEPGGD
jgi:hypothetical protein